MVSGCLDLPPVIVCCEDAMRDRLSSEYRDVASALRGIGKRGRWEVTEP